ncbi:MAG TPA: serine/threonine-protein kinase PknK [Oscillatoriaceae cyanobacterium M33_DOE_052]|uniref:Serine/threonine-protein kinase PknK n=1 Tax=Planktothricoides sp. SpSt-374 TaxID=2282167 RepID=A0A7C3VK53_9CYAN|nr:serine/threonine-protein kinase PknK [Oscillatoriaceae cyanobacterium M33_DOE_052]
MGEIKINLKGYQINEQIYAGTRTLVYRGVRLSDQQPVAIKIVRNELPRFSEMVQFRNQYVITKNLDVPNIVKPYSMEIEHNRYALIMEDFGGISLSSYLAAINQADHKNHSLPSCDFFPIALQIAEILDGLYRHRVIHKDIKPANILINPQTKQVKLIDFSIASVLPRETQLVQMTNVLEGTLPYLSPEQTGRMNRGIDYRTDFYSLGVTFYELLAGALPFASDDPIELIHCHLAKEPVPLHHLKETIPSVLSDIVAKLMAKNAEDRYQSATGLKHDLEICWHHWQTGAMSASGGAIVPDFPLGEWDICDRFTIPEKLYGRETEVQTLLAAFDTITTVPENQNHSSNSQMMLVAGFSGVGKTAVINEIHKPIVRQRGYFIKGKFDQFGRNVPWAAFVQAFRHLMAQLLSETDAKIETWKTAILAALGENAQVIVEVIPELEMLIGPQPPAAELSGTAAQNRFHALFQKFIRLFATPEHPLVIFLDDLQWADGASLDLIKVLMTDSGINHLLLIGAYRDNAVHPGHPLMLTLAEIKKSGATINTLTLAPLQQSDVNRLIADTLSPRRLGNATDKVRALAAPLTELVYQKTKGNPFFITQFLKSLHDDGIIKFVPPTRDRGNSGGGWQCDIAKVRELALTDDVVEFVARQLQKLPAATQEALKLAACIGHQFDLNTLAIVLETSPSAAAADLWKALQDGLVQPTSEVYKLFQEPENAIALGAKSESPLRTFDQNATYQFLHDRIQQAAYGLIPPPLKKATHLKIGQLLLNNTPAAEWEDKIFDTVNQLNYGIDLIIANVERLQLAQLNLKCGRKAKSATAYAAAGTYLNIGRQLLAMTNAWQNQYEIALHLHVEGAEVAYLSSNFSQMEELAQIVLQNATNLLDKVKIYEIQLAACTAQMKPQTAVEIGLQVLQLLGVTFPAQPTPLDVERELGQTAAMFAEKPEVLNVNKKVVKIATIML